MAYQSSVEDIEDEINSWGNYTMSPSEYERTLNEPETRIPQGKVGGRGRGITNPVHMANIRLASDISDLKGHTFPMGHLATTKELLAGPAENEITPMLRQLGISSGDVEVRSSTTRKNPKGKEEIRLDGNLPVILDGALFNAHDDADDEGIAEIEEFDPKLPLYEQFSTIPELVIAEEEARVLDSVPKSKPKAKKTNATNSSVDSGITNTSSSSDQSKKSKTKKKKWRKMTAEELIPTEPERGRYEEVYAIGVHSNANLSGFAPRQMFSDRGLKGWPAP